MTITVHGYFLPQNLVSPAHTASGILITKMSYPLLVKSFSDDLSWRIPEMLVVTYLLVALAYPELSHIVMSHMQQLVRMPLAEAQHAAALAELESLRDHGQRGNQSMSLLCREKKGLTPVLAKVWVWSQSQLTGFDAVGGEDNP